jgi:hypothetical protein
MAAIFRLSMKLGECGFGGDSLPFIIVFPIWVWPGYIRVSRSLAFAQHWHKVESVYDSGNIIGKSGHEPLGPHNFRDALQPGESGC